MVLKVVNKKVQNAKKTDTEESGKPSVDLKISKNPQEAERSQNINDFKDVKIDNVKSPETLSSANKQATGVLF